MLGENLPLNNDLRGANNDGAIFSDTTMSGNDNVEENIETHKEQERNNHNAADAEEDKDLNTEPNNTQENNE